jgi:hypothetical protein
MAIEVPPSVRKFIELKVDSVELLHVLMLLQDRPDVDWTVRSISDELRSSETSVQARIRALIQTKVLAPDAMKDGQVRYVPFDAEVGAHAKETIDLYRLAPYRIVDLIFSKRTDAIRSIADAFRFRKEGS